MNGFVERLPVDLLFVQLHPDDGKLAEVLKAAFPDTGVLVETMFAVPTGSEDAVVVLFGWTERQIVPLVEETREAGNQVRIIACFKAITNRSDGVPGLMLLNAGADDAQFDPDGRELVERIHAVRRRGASLNMGGAQLGNTLLDFRSGFFEVGAVRLSLTPQEERLLQALHNANGRMVTKPQMADCISASIHEPAGDRTVVTVVCNCRRKLLEAGSDVLISTVWGRGWYLEVKKEKAA